MATLVCAEKITVLPRCPDPDDERKLYFEKCRIRPEKGRTIGVYEASYFKNISPENGLEKYLRELERIWNKNGKCNTEVDSTGDDCGDYIWLYTRETPYLFRR